MSSKHEDGQSVKSSNEDADAPLNRKALIVQSPGVQRIDAISSTVDTPLQIALFVSIFLVAYVYGLGTY